jgi:choline dehydrogenase-like flavoprotein
MDLKELVQDDVEEYDICVIGSGPAGLSLVMSLLEHDKKVLLLESGSEEIDAEFQDLNKGINVGSRYLDLESSRLRCFGGAGKIWAGVCRPLSKVDFQDRSLGKLFGWPIEYAELEKYYKKAAGLLGIDFTAFSRSVARGVFDHVFPDNDVGSKSAVRHNKYIIAKHMDLADRYGSKIKSASNVTIYTNATVVDFLFKGSSVSSCLATTIDKKRFQFNAKTFVLCAGALEIPRILLNSSLYNSRHRPPALGSYFMSHPAFVDVARLVLNASADLCGPSSIDDEKFDHEVGFPEQLSKGILRHNMSFKPSSEFDRKHGSFDDEQLFSWKENLEILGLFKRATCRILGRRMSGQVWDVSVGIEQEPRLLNGINLSDEVDFLGVRRLKINWASVSALEQKTVLEALRVLTRELIKNGLGTIEISKKLIDKSAFAREDAINHHIGTTRMSSKREYGVVDKNLRCFDYKNLYISSSSVFPTSSNVNPTFTIVALSLRLADHLRTEV